MIGTNRRLRYCRRNTAGIPTSAVGMSVEFSIYFKLAACQYHGRPVAVSYTVLAIVDVVLEIGDLVISTRRTLAIRISPLLLLLVVVVLLLLVVKSDGRMVARRPARVSNCSSSV